MLELVNTIKDLAKNVKEYQRAAIQSKRITPSFVRHWYCIPALDMVGASRFIGYKDMTMERYDQCEEVDGRETQRQLQRKGWFRQLESQEQQYAHAYHLAASLDKMGGVWISAKFYVLKDIYDNQIRV